MKRAQNSAPTRRRLGISHRIAAITVATEERQISGRFRALLCGRFKATAMFGLGLRLQPSDAPGDRLYRHHQTLPEWSRGARDGGMEARQPIPRPTADGDDTRGRGAALGPGHGYGCRLVLRPHDRASANSLFLASRASNTSAADPASRSTCSRINRCAASASPASMASTIFQCSATVRVMRRG